MRFTLVGAALALFSALVEAQTFTDCNPLERSLGRAASFDFTNGPFNDFKEVGNPTYGADGAAFTISKRGEAPLIQSNWYIMFGRVEMVVKAAPGTGIVSSGVLQSDDLDEIDWEWLGANNNQVQTNYFGKGNTQSYSRGAWHDAPNNHDVFHTYTIDWSSTQLVWQIDGRTVRVVTPETAEGQYPQSPMMVKVGIWSGGDPGNAPGTIQWAGGETDYSAGPYTMYLKSLDVTDYSTGSSYSYSDKSGSWQSIRSEGGQVNGNINEEPKSVTTTPPVTATVDSAPIPWDGTHRETSTFEPPNVWPWVPSTFSSSVPTMTSVPSGWAVSGTGKVQPPSSAASSTQQSASSASLSGSPSLFGADDSTGTAASTGPEPTSGSAADAKGTATGKALSSITAHAAPPAGAANGMREVPAAMGAFCMLVGGGLAMF
ncbi:Cell wall [Aspergillus sp. HF37]|nr:Cell wall [Aspergillus sp. HF37]